ncbi:9190_t:CDS:2 [Entrophospora sp. SA101]|nr:9190_t:CDS:2 [Entrophospora sp. SA101]
MGYPLKSKSSIEVTANLFDLFTTFGAPTILQPDNGKEFNSQDLENKLSKWMKGNHRDDWSFALKIIIHSMNTPISRPTHNTPYCLVLNQEVMIQYWNYYSLMVALMKHTK